MTTKDTWSPTPNRTYSRFSTKTITGNTRIGQFGGRLGNAGLHGLNGISAVLGDTQNFFSGHNLTKPFLAIGRAIRGGYRYIAEDVPKTPPAGNQAVKDHNPGNKAGGGGGGSNLDNAGKKPPKAAEIQSDPDSTYSWNLPPHAWSLPVDPSVPGQLPLTTVKDGKVDRSNTVVGYGDKESAFHSTRRGKIFVAYPYQKYTGAVDSSTGKVLENNDKFAQNYGFQFLWNPETFSQSTSVNWGITPNQNDIGALLTGLVASNSSIELTLRIDRTNDFAAAKLYYEGNEDYFAQYYTKGQAPGSSKDFSKNINKKIKDLLERGTDSDIEYLYRTINGGEYKAPWGPVTSNINFLMPTIIRLDLGQRRLVGIIQSISVNHLAFTREMLPIRTDVTISVDLRTSTALITNNLGGTSDQVKAANS